MKATRGFVAGVVSVLLCWSAVASTPTASAAIEPIAATVGCGFVDLHNGSSDEVGVIHGDPGRKNEDGFVWLASNASKHITTTWSITTASWRSSRLWRRAAIAGGFWEASLQKRIQLKGSECSKDFIRISTESC